MQSGPSRPVQDQPRGPAVSKQAQGGDGEHTESSPREEDEPSGSPLGRGQCWLTAAPTPWEARAAAISEQALGTCLTLQSRPSGRHRTGPRLQILISHLPRLQTTWEGKARELERPLRGTPGRQAALLPSWRPITSEEQAC